MKSLLVGLLFFLLITPTLFAQEQLEIDESPTIVPVADVDYTLPYPGILPDNPLYIFKAARDRVVSFFISDPVKKADFALLQADKRIQAGMFLFDKEDADIALAVSTISKGQNYYEEAVQSYTDAKKSKKQTEIGDLPDRLNRAARKYAEVLKNGERTLPHDKKQEFQSVVTRSETLISLIAAAQVKK